MTYREAAKTFNVSQGCVRLSPSLVKVACELNESIESGEIPYEGFLDIY